MPYIDPHIHMVSRTTDDYAAMAAAGCVAVTEPAFWAGYDRRFPEAFLDYFHQLTAVEPKRAAQYGIDHYCWLCINPKEAEDPQFAREVIQLIPEFLDRPNVLGIGEIGLNRNTKNEMLILEEQLAFASKYDQLVLVHTPHLEDKLKGTKLILDAIKRNGNLSPDRVLIDHAEEHTIDLILDAGYWAGLTLYPTTKCTPQRAADILESYGSERLWVNSAGDWGPSDPLSVPKFQRELLNRGHNAALVEQAVMNNPRKFLSQNPRFLPSSKPSV
ncbi:MAG: TatD family hydrolase [Planctomycetota bacterium]